MRTSGEEGPRLVLSEDEQRSLYGRVALLDRCNEALLARLPGTEMSALGRARLPGEGGGRRCRRRRRRRAMTRKRRPPPRAHSISCTDDEWERVRVLAERRGLSMSRYFVECGLNVDPKAEAPKPPRLVLDEAEQRRLHDTVVRIAERTAAARIGGSGAHAHPQRARVPGRGTDAGDDARRPRVRAESASHGPVRGAGCGGGGGASHRTHGHRGPGLAM